MKIHRSILLAGAIVAAALSTGCAWPTIQAASTKVSYQHGKSDKLEFSFPKEAVAKSVTLSIDPKTGVASFHADNWQSSSSQVITAAGNADAQTVAVLAQLLQQLAPLLARPAAAAAGLPMLPSFDTAPANAANEFLVK